MACILLHADAAHTTVRCCVRAVESMQSWVNTTHCSRGEPVSVAQMPVQIFLLGTPLEYVIPVIRSTTCGACSMASRKLQLLFTLQCKEP